MDHYNAARTAADLREVGLVGPHDAVVPLHRGVERKSPMFLNGLNKEEASIGAFGDRLGQAAQLGGRGFQALGRHPTHPRQASNTTRTLATRASNWDATTFSSRYEKPAASKAFKPTTSAAPRGASPRRTVAQHFSVSAASRSISCPVPSCVRVVLSTSQLGTDALGGRTVTPSSVLSGGAARSSTNEARVTAPARCQAAGTNGSPLIHLAGIALRSWRQEGQPWSRVAATAGNELSGLLPRA